MRSFHPPPQKTVEAKKRKGAASFQCEPTHQHRDAPCRENGTVLHPSSHGLATWVVLLKVTFDHFLVRGIFRWRNHWRTVLRDHFVPIHGPNPLTWQEAPVNHDHFLGTKAWTWDDMTKPHREEVQLISRQSGWLQHWKPQFSLRFPTSVQIWLLWSVAAIFAKPQVLILHRISTP